MNIQNISYDKIEVNGKELPCENGFVYINTESDTD